MRRCHRPVTALEEMTPSLRVSVLMETASPIVARIQSLAAELARHYGSMAALAVVTGRRGELSAERLMLALPDAKVFLDITTTEQDQAVWAQAMADVEEDPNADIRLPPDKAPPPPMPRIGRFFSRKG